MPDVSRSDSNRSDASRPRVSFNRNVHVKRINGPNTANAYSISSDGTTFVPTSIRRERPMTKKEMTKEAEVVLKHVDKVSCTATTNLRIDEDKQKWDKKRRKTFSFLKRNEPQKKLEKRKNSSSDVDSASSQEYRIYRVNGPLSKTEVLENGKHHEEDPKRKKGTIKTYDFMSLDRKRLKKEKKKESLDYLSLEKNTEVLRKMKKGKPNRTVLSTVFDRVDGRNKRPDSEVPMKGSDGSDEQSPIKMQLYSHEAENQPEKKRESNLDKLIKKLSETTTGTLTKNTGKTGMREPQSDTCHNDNRPFSYMNGEKSDSKEKTGTRTAEGLGDSKEDSKCVSPTNDVIYAQVIVGGRDGNVQKATVNERVASNEVGSVFVGDDPNQSQVGINYNIQGKRNGEICETVTVKSDQNSKKEVLIFPKMLSTEFHGDNKMENSRISPSPVRDDYTRIVKVSPKNDYNKCGDKYPSDLHDLSIRREILLSRSESQAKERFNSLKRLQEPTKVKRTASNLNGIRHQDRPLRNEPKFTQEDTIPFPDKFDSTLRKKRDDALVNDTRKIDPTNPKKNRPSKLDAYLKEKADIWKNIDKVHLIKTDDDDDNLFRKLTKFTKSKTTQEDSPKPKKTPKVKTFFKKKKDPAKGDHSEDDPLASRYVEYRGSDVDVSDRSTDSSHRRPPYPRPGDLSDSKSTSLRFFGDTDQESTQGTPDFYVPKSKPKTELYRPGKTTDSDEDHFLGHRPDSRTTNSTRKGSPTGKTKSKYDLDNPDYGLKQMNHSLNLTPNKHHQLSNSPDLQAGAEDPYDINGMKYVPNIKRSVSSLTNSTKYGTKEKLRNLKSTPVITVTSPRESLSRRVKSHGNLYSQDDRKGGRRRLYDSSAESATEGDSSQNSSKSMIYLHAATVGDIPGPRNIYRSNKRSQSREELSSAEENSTISPSGKKTLSRSFSVLAPWRPKHDKEDRTLYYDSVDFGRGKPPTGTVKTKLNSGRERKASELRFNTLGKENRRRKDLLR